jgi:hypothetical protein
MHMHHEGLVEPMQRTRLFGAHWGRAFLLLAFALCVGSCRRNRFPSRGDAAAVVVVVPRADAAGPPRVLEQEPNDSPEQAQMLAINLDWPVLTVEGTLSGPGEGKGRDVDVFKLMVPGHGLDPAVPAAARDSAQPDDARLAARKLSCEIVSSAGSGVSLQLLDDGLKSLETISADPGDAAGMPNMAALPGRMYYFRVKAQAKPGKSRDLQATGSSYKLTIQLGDFEVAEEREPNDGLDTAQPLALVGTADFAGLFGWQHDQDFYRIPTPEIASAVDIELDAVEGVAAGLQVLDGGGTRIAAGKGRKGDRLALHNVTVPAATVDAGAASRFFYLVARAESGHNRAQRYVLHITLGSLKQDAEIEPNDTPAKATAVRDGTISGFLPVGDVDYFRYTGDGQREVSFEVSCPTRVRGKLEVVRPSDGQVLGSAEAKKARQTVVLAKILSLGEPLLVRLSQGKGDGNPNEPYSLRISSAPVPIQKIGATNSPSTLNPD